MAPTGRKGVGRPRRRTMKDPDMGADDKEETKDLSGSEQDGKEGKTPVTDKNGRKRPSAGPVEEEVGAEVQNMLETVGADIKKVLIAKKRRFEMNTSASVKSSNQKIEQVWKTQQEQWQKLTRDYSQQFLALFQQCHMDIKRVEEQEVKLILMFRQQQRMLQQSRILLSQTLKAFTTVYEQFMKNIEDMEKNHEHLLTQAQSELRKDLASMLNKILVESQQQEMAIVQKSLQSLVFC